VVELHQVTALLYLASGLAAALGLALPAPRMNRAGLVLLMGGAGVHTLSFLALHALPDPPSLTALPSAISITVWMGVVFFLLMLRRARLSGLVVLVAPAAFVGVLGAALGLPGGEDGGLTPSASWSHVHILLSAGGLAFVAVAGLAGLLFLVGHRSLKTKSPAAAGLPLPSLEALDRVNRIALAIGFPLLTLGVVSGVLWVHAASGELWPGTPHANWTLVAWAIYAVLTVARFGIGQGARQSALSAVLGLAFLLFAVVGVGVFAS
jgi:ABC-type transport system involved in cytochrome c biogenesis permease subunit